MSLNQIIENLENTLLPETSEISEGRWQNFDFHEFYEGYAGGSYLHFYPFKELKGKSFGKKIQGIVVFHGKKAKLQSFLDKDFDHLQMKKVHQDDVPAKVIKAMMDKYGQHMTEGWSDPIDPRSVRRSYHRMSKGITDFNDIAQSLNMSDVHTSHSLLKKELRKLRNKLSQKVQGFRFNER